jgi:hypothetical protein
MRAWGEAYDYNTRIWIAESRHGLAPIFLIDICFALDARHFLAPCNQAFTFTAGNDFLVKYV